MTNNIKRDTRQFLSQAWARDNENIVTGSALLLGLVMKIQGSRSSKDDVHDLLVLMNDPNVED